MTQPAPYNRDTLAGIRAAARENVPLETYAHKLGWTAGMLRNVCRQNCIDMSPGPAAGAAVAPVKHEARTTMQVGGLVFDGEGAVWNGDRSLSLDADVVRVLERIARAAPRVAARVKVAEAVFGDLGADRRARRMDAAVAILTLGLPSIGCRLTLFEDGKYLALSKTERRS